MKKIIISSLLIIPILLYFLCFVKLDDINAISVEIIVNDKWGSVDYNIDNQDLIEEISEHIAKKRYFKQPLYDIYSRNEVDSEITIYKMNDNKQVVTWYRILLNNDDGGGISNRSRIDLMRMGGETVSKWRSFTVFLSNEQVEELTDSLQQYLPQSNMN